MTKNLFDMLGSSPGGMPEADPLAGLADWIHAHQQKQAVANTSALANRAVGQNVGAVAGQGIGSPAGLAAYGPQIAAMLQAAMQRQAEQQAQREAAARAMQPQPGGAQRPVSGGDLYTQMPRGNF